MQVFSLVDDVIELRVPSKPEYVSVARALIAELARRMKFSAQALEDVQVAVSEACANAVCHAYPEQHSDTPDIIIRCSTANERLTIEVEDNGLGFPNQDFILSRQSERDGGLGLLLIRNLVDDVSLDTSPDRGTTVRMIKDPRPSTARSSRARSLVG